MAGLNVSRVIIRLFHIFVGTFWLMCGNWLNKNNVREMKNNLNELYA